MSVHSVKTSYSNPSFFASCLLLDPWNQLFIVYHTLISWSEWRTVLSPIPIPFSRIHEACKMRHYCLIHIAPLSNINYLTSLLLSHAFRSCRHCYSTRYHQCHLWLRPQWTLIWLCCPLLSIHWLLFYLCFFWQLPSLILAILPLSSPVQVQLLEAAPKVTSASHWLHPPMAFCQFSCDFLWA